LETHHGSLEPLLKAWTLDVQPGQRASEIGGSCFGNNRCATPETAAAHPADMPSSTTAGIVGKALGESSPEIAVHRGPWWRGGPFRGRLKSRVGARTSK